MVQLLVELLWASKKSDRLSGGQFRTSAERIAKRSLVSVRRSCHFYEIGSFWTRLGSLIAYQLLGEPELEKEMVVEKAMSTSSELLKQTFARYMRETDNSCKHETCGIKSASL